MVDAAEAFAGWLAEHSGTLPVHLNIARSRYVSAAVKGVRNGFEDVLRSYRWKAGWVGADGTTRRSEDWPSTRASLNELGNWLSHVVDDEAASDGDVLTATLRVVDWGGGKRSAGKGADKFLRSKAQSGQLQSYLRRARLVLHEAAPGDRALHEIELMNSMMTKVHALLAKDGLPIYDTRVACALGCLVELYRRDAGLAWRKVPVSIAFPALSRDRSVSRAMEGAVAPGMIYYTSPRATADWVDAKLRARSVLSKTLRNAPQLFEAEGDMAARLHAFEATLFMIGSSPSTLSAVRQRC